MAVIIIDDTPKSTRISQIDKTIGKYLWARNSYFHYYAHGYKLYDPVADELIKTWIFSYFLIGFLSIGIFLFIGKNIYILFILQLEQLEEFKEKEKKDEKIKCDETKDEKKKNSFRFSFVFKFK
jgi:hypothetical protein